MKKVAETGLAFTLLLKELFAQKAEIFHLRQHILVLSRQMHWAEKREQEDGCGLTGSESGFVNPTETTSEIIKAVHGVEEKKEKKMCVEEEEKAEPVRRGQADEFKAGVACTSMAEDEGTGNVALTMALTTKSKEPESCGDGEPVEVLDYGSCVRVEKDVL